MSSCSFNALLSSLSCPSGAVLVLPELILSLLHPLYGHASELFFFIKTIAKMLLLLESNAKSITKMLMFL